MNKNAFKWLAILLTLFGLAALLVTAMPVFGYPLDRSGFFDMSFPTQTQPQRQKHPRTHLKRSNILLHEREFR